MQQFKCYFCRDEGISGGCPDCGLDSKENISTPNLIESVNKDKLDVNFIPSFYRGRIWDMNVLFDDHEELIGDKAFGDIVSSMHKVHSGFQQGVLPSKSIILCMPHGMSKMTWIYSCMQYALAHNKKVFPLFDSAQMRSFLVMSFEQPDAKWLDSYNINIDDLLMCDVVFLTVTKTYLRGKAYEVILELLDLLGRLGKVVIVASSYPVEEISKYDEYGNFKSLCKVRNFDLVDGLRYPAILQYF